MSSSLLIASPSTSSPISSFFFTSSFISSSNASLTPVHSPSSTLRIDGSISSLCSGSDDRSRSSNR